MTADPLMIVRTNGRLEIHTDDTMGLVLLEAARRDLNAMSQALGASSEFKNRYAGYARTLSDAAAQIPRVDLPTGRAMEVKETLFGGRSLVETPAAPPVVEDADLDDLLG